MFKDLEIDKPHTWIETGMKVLEKVSHTGGTTKLATDLMSESMRRIDYTRIQMDALKGLFESAMRHVNTRLIYEKRPYRLYEIQLPNKTRIFMKTNRALKDFDQNQSFGEDIRFYFPDATKCKDELRETFKGVGELFWDHNEHIILDKQRFNPITFKPLDVENRGYEGDAVGYIEEWKVFMEAGVRRCVLLQGAPGTGKSTLARHASVLLSKRTLHLTQDFIINVDRDMWSFLNDMLRPEVIVVDDIDRIDHDYLRNRLYLFEDAYHDVPLTMMTANHYTELPDAFLRPGRIDQIIQLDDPKDHVKVSVLKELAKKEGIEEIPKDRMRFLLEVYKNYSGAYVVEYLRRVKVLGWDYRIPAMDLTFEKIIGFEDLLENDQKDDDSKIVEFRARIEEINTESGRVLTINPMSDDDEESG
jgi:energy-coupling factor transporter ATP-binding protein EcfA2